MAYNKVLLATDLHPDNEVVVTAAIEASSGAELSVVHVIEPIATMGYGNYPMGAFADQVVGFHSEIRRQSREKLDELADRLSIPHERAMLREGRSAFEIHSVAEEMQADLIVIGTHGQHGIKLLLGSTANSVLHGVSCDVLVVRVKA